jgi:hypothetical protein
MAPLQYGISVGPFVFASGTAWEPYPAHWSWVSLIILKGALTAEKKPFPAGQGRQKGHPWAVGLYGVGSY